MINQPNVLQIVSEWSLRILLANELTRCGYIVHSAKNDLEAREIVSGDLPIHAAILSSSPDQSTTQQLVDFIKSKRPGIGIIIIAGCSDSDSVLAGMKVFSVIKRPVSIPELFITLEAAIKEVE